jgi:predicted PurR-regulated permease PerM
MDSEELNKDENVANGAAPPDTGAIRSSHSSVPISRYAILGLLTVIGLALFPIIKMFIVPVILATTFTTLFYPLYRVLLRWCRGNRALASLLVCMVLVLCFVIPVYVVVHVVVVQLMQFYQTAEPALREMLTRGGESGILLRLKALPILHGINFESLNIVAIVTDTAKTLLSSGSKFINKTSAGIFGLVANILVMFFTMFYFFMDGERIVKKIKYLSPIRDDYEDLIFARFLLISRATVLGTMVIAIAQGSIGALALLIFGIKSWMLWGVIMIFLALIPLAGAWPVLISAGLIQIFTGHLWQGIGIIAISLGVVSTIDNLIRPRLVGQSAKLHDLVIFFSSLGGIVTFGPMGVIVGPVVAALFIAVLDIYSTEFEPQLNEANERWTRRQKAVPADGA